MFAASYGISVSLAYAAREPGGGADELFIPVAGPVMAAVYMERNIQRCYKHADESEEIGCTVSRLGSLFGYPLLAIDLLAQAGGLALMGTGVFGLMAKRSTPPTENAGRVTVMPYLTGTSAGLSGTF